MNKSNLRSGMLVELRNGERAWVLKDTVDGDWLQWINDSSCLKLEDYNEDLTCCNVDAYNKKEYDIMKIYSPMGYKHLDEDFINDMEVVYERKEYKEITKYYAARILKDYFGCNIKIVE